MQLSVLQSLILQELAWYSNKYHAWSGALALGEKQPKAGIYGVYYERPVRI